MALKAVKGEEKLPINKKFALTIGETAEYTNLGINKIYDLCNTPGCAFVLYSGKRKLIKREALEEYLSTHQIV